MNRRRWMMLIGLAGTTAGAWATVRAVELGAHRARTRPECLDGIPDRDYQYRPRSPSVVTTSRRALLLAVTQVDDTVQPAPTEGSPSRLPASGARVNLLPPPMEPIPPTHRFREAELPAPEETLELVPPGTSEPVDEADSAATRRHRRPGVNRAQYETIASPRSISRHDRRPVDESYQPIEWERLDLADKLIAAERRTVTRLYQLDRTRLTIDHCEISQVALQLRGDGVWALSLRADQNARYEGPGPAPYNPKLHLKRNEFHLKLRCLGVFATSAGVLSPAAGQPVLVDLEPEPFWVENGQPRYARLVGCDRRLMGKLERIDRVELEFFYR